MATNSIIFALANPTPEVAPDVAHRHASVDATGRSDYPNQINNVLAFPGIFAGAFDCGACTITEGMKLAAATALGDVVADFLEPDWIVPTPFDARVVPAVLPRSRNRRDGKAWCGNRDGAWRQQLREESEDQATTSWRSSARDRSSPCQASAKPAHRLLQPRDRQRERQPQKAFERAIDPEAGARDQDDAVLRGCHGKRGRQRRVEFRPDGQAARGDWYLPFG